MIEIHKLFYIEYGQKEYHSKLGLKEKKNGIPLITAKTKDNGISGCFDIQAKYENCLSLSVVGENACTALFQKNKCCINDNCLVLKPKFDLSEQQMLYYAQIITMFKQKFPAYGRNVTPSRIRNIKIPNISEIPIWVNEIQILDLEHLSDKILNIDTPELNTENWREYKLYSNLFEMEAGKYYPLTSFERGETPLISSTNDNNGITKFTNLKPVYGGNCITIGKVSCSAYYQKIPFSATSDVTILIPKFNMNQFNGLFIASVINKEAFRWNYGHQIRLNNCQNMKIKLPSKIDTKGSYIPDFQLMEEYIKTLHFSKNI